MHCTICLRITQHCTQSKTDRHELYNTQVSFLGKNHGVKKKKTYDELSPGKLCEEICNEILPRLTNITRGTAHY